MTFKLLVALLLLAMLGNASVSVANNNLFLPGDAFFPTVLTKANVEAMQKAKTGKRTFAYSSLEGYSGAFCGYAGYANATIAAVDDPFAKNLAAVYQTIREYRGRELREETQEGKAPLVETNGIPVLFYRAEFEFPRHKLGLRYNENWVAETVKFGHRKEHIRLCSLVDDAAAVERCWRDAELVPGLKVYLPEIELKPVPATEAPVVVQDTVKAIVLGSHMLMDLFQPKADDDLTIYIVDSKGTMQLVYRDGEWTAKGQE